MSNVPPSPTIIDLTEIIEPGNPVVAKAAKVDELGAHASDLMGNSAGDDVELDDLLAQLNDGEEPKAPTREINPDESLNMPGMDAMDALFGEIDKKGPAKAAAPAAPAAPAKAAAPADMDLDALLAGFDEPKAPKTAPSAPQSAPASSSGAGDSDLDDLLGDLTAPVAAAPKEQNAKPDDDLDSLLDGLIEAPKPVSAPLKEQDLDSLLDELDSGDKRKPIKETDLDDLLAQLDEPAPTPARKAKPEDALSSLLDEMDVPPSGPMGRTEESETGAVDTASLDELMAGGHAAPPLSASAGSAHGGDLPGELAEGVRSLQDELSAVRDEVRQAAEGLRLVLDEHGAVRQAILELQEHRENSPAQPDMFGALTGRLDVIEAMAASLSEKDVAVSADLKQGLVEIERLQDRVAKLGAKQTRLDELDHVQERLQAFGTPEEFFARLDGLNARLDTLEAGLASAQHAAQPEVDGDLAANAAADVAGVAERVQALEAAQAEAVQQAAATAAALDSRLSEAVQVQAAEQASLRAELEASFDARLAERLEARLAECGEQLQTHMRTEMTESLAKFEPVAASPDIAAIAAQVLDILRPEIERAAASAAAKIIREEISELLSEEE